MLQDGKKAYVTKGFANNLHKMIDDITRDVSFKDLAELLVLQPLAVALLFEKAVKICQDSGSRLLKRPHSVQSIINILGFDGVLKAITHIEEAPHDHRAAAYKNATETYALACVLAKMAEKNGHRHPQDFFLYGILHGAIQEKALEAFSGSTDLARYLSISNDATIPSPEQAAALIKEFEEFRSTSETKELFRIWKQSSTRIRNILERIRQAADDPDSAPIYAEGAISTQSHVRR